MSSSSSSAYSAADSKFVEFGGDSDAATEARAAAVRKACGEAEILMRCRHPNIAR